MQTHGETTVGLILEELVRAAIPDLHRARAVVPLGDLALEAPVFERVILNVDGEMLLARFERDALRHRPRGEDAVALEAEVVMERSRGVSLHHEDRPFRLTALRTEGLRCALSIALALVFA